MNRGQVKTTRAAWGRRANTRGCDAMRGAHATRRGRRRGRWGGAAEVQARDAGAKLTKVAADGRSKVGTVPRVPRRGRDIWVHRAMAVRCRYARNVTRRSSPIPHSADAPHGARGGARGGAKGVVVVVWFLQDVLVGFVFVFSSLPVCAPGSEGRRETARCRCWRRTWRCVACVCWWVVYVGGREELRACGEWSRGQEGGVVAG